MFEIPLTEISETVTSARESSGFFILKVGADKGLRTLQSDGNSRVVRWKNAATGAKLRVRCTRAESSRRERVRSSSLRAHGHGHVRVCTHHACTRLVWSRVGGDHRVRRFTPEARRCCTYSTVRPFRSFTRMFSPTIYHHVYVKVLNKDRV